MELFSSLLLDDLGDRPGPRRLVSQIAEGIKDLNHLVTNILGFTRAPVPRPTRVDVVAAVEDALRYGAPLLAESGVAIVRHYESPRIVARADPSFVRQVFLNLIRNAAQAMESGGVLTVGAQRGARGGAQDGAQDGANVAVSFADTGPGVPREARQRIFEPFFTTKERGTGLGLAIVRTLVETLGGEVTERAGAAEGACFTVILPAADEPARATRGGEEDAGAALQGAPAWGNLRQPEAT
jgi:signal transduction histidine kinase